MSSRLAAPAYFGAAAVAAEEAGDPSLGVWAAASRVSRTGVG
jgi:hypothetical protein